MDGAPFPIEIDRSTGGYELSKWKKGNGKGRGKQMLESFNICTSSGYYYCPESGCCSVMKGSWWAAAAVRQKDTSKVQQ